MSNCKVTKEKFSAVKYLLESGCPKTECSKYMKLSAWTIRLIASVETYEEYQQVMAERNLKQKRYYAATKASKTESTGNNEVDEPAIKPQETKQTVIVQASHYMLEEQKKTNELLTSISNKLAFIVEELTGTRSEEKVEGA